MADLLFACMTLDFGQKLRQVFILAMAAQHQAARQIKHGGGHRRALLVAEEVLHAFTKKRDGAIHFCSYMSHLLY